MFNTIFPKIHKEGYQFLVIGIVASFLGLLLSKTLGLILVLITIWIYYFFRDPERFSIKDDNYLVSPADGLISNISNDVSGPLEIALENKKFTKVSIFMNVFNCHVNRSPLSAQVEEIFYKPGKFLNASLDKASEENERNYYKLKSKNGEEIILVQIAGLIARRIVCEVKKDQSLEQGERVGMIRFGSRVDLYFNDRKLLVKVGQNVSAGESLIAVK
tara:strand:+ start:841 stop:1491 length:651 start_codon:yes stop_codon:yes gene_type:complete